MTEPTDINDPPKKKPASKKRASLTLASSKVIPNKKATNSEMVISHIEANIYKIDRKIKESDNNSLRDYFLIGEYLCEVNEARGPTFLRQWAKDKFGYERAWVYRLKQLYKKRPEIDLALASLENPQSVRMTPDGVLQFLREKNCASKAGASRNKPAVPKLKKAELERDLASARCRIEQLEAVLRANDLEPPLEIPETSSDLPAQSDDDDASKGTTPSHDIASDSGEDEMDNDTEPDE